MIDVLLMLDTDIDWCNTLSGVADKLLNFNLTPILELPINLYAINLDLVLHKQPFRLILYSDDDDY